MEDSPFRLPSKKPLKLVGNLVERMTGLHQLDYYYQQRPLSQNTQEFLRYTLSSLNIQYHISAGSVGNIPATGPLVIVANHPLGAAEGVILAEIIMKVRPDVKILANQYLGRIKELSSLFISVDVFEGESALSANMKAMRAAINFLNQDGVVLVFPAGEVSTYNKQGFLSDKAWSRSVAKLIKRSNANVLAMHVDGKNSRRFYWAGKVHPLLRTAMLGRELLNKQHQPIGISIGKVIQRSEVLGLDSEQQMVDYLRLNTYLLAPHEHHTPPLLNQQPVIDEIPSPLLIAEIAQLPAEDHLLSFKQFDVYCSDFESIPSLIKEIGRVREINFRQVNEGTGSACDLDDFDKTYKHLFVWDKEKAALVGAYRLGLSDKLMPTQGVKGFYSRSLFKYDKTLIDQFGYAIEMGRSVISMPYQRSLTALLLLWKGIATYAHRHPHYTHLFGPVSISSEYSPLARQLMVSTLQAHYFDNESAQLVKATNPLKNSKVGWGLDMLSALADIQLLSKVLVRLGQAGVPVLIKQYLNLNGKLISFNVDKDFNDALDGLIVVDLRNVPLRTLGKYMGQKEAQTYLDFHQKTEHKKELYPK